MDAVEIVTWAILGGGAVLGLLVVVAVFGVLIKFIGWLFRGGK